MRQHELDRTELPTEHEQRKFLNCDGNLHVPCSRYGTDTFQCTEVAIVAERVYCREAGTPVTVAGIDRTMGLVVNDSDEIQQLIEDHGTKEEQEFLADKLA
jgi:hypothetical protein